jgi:hypothetical protein
VKTNDGGTGWTNCTTGGATGGTNGRNTTNTGPPAFTKIRSPPTLTVLVLTFVFVFVFVLVLTGTWPRAGGESPTRTIAPAATASSFFTSVLLVWTGDASYAPPADGPPPISGPEVA